MNSYWRLVRWGADLFHSKQLNLQSSTGYPVELGRMEQAWRLGLRGWGSIILIKMATQNSDRRN